MSGELHLGPGWHLLDDEESTFEHDHVLIEYDGSTRRKWVYEDPRALPTEPGAVIQWKDSAYLPQLAQLDPGHRQLGWRANDGAGSSRWFTPEELLERIDGHRWHRLIPLEDEQPTSNALPTEPYTVIQTGVFRWMKDGLWRDGSHTGNPNAWLLLPGETPAENRRIKACGLTGQVIYDHEKVLEQAEGVGFKVLSRPVS